MKSIRYSFFLMLLLVPFGLKAQYSNFHQTHTGEIVFCSEPVIPGKEQQQELKQTFQPNEQVYAMAYFDKPFNEIAEKRYIGFTVWVDGNKKELTFSKPGVNKRFTFYRMINQYVDKPHYPVEIKPNKDQATNEVEVEGWANFLKDLGPGTHQLKIRMRYPSGTLAEGRITLQWDDFNAGKFESRTRAILNAIEKSHAKTNKLPEEFKQSRRKFVDPDMSEDRIKFFLLLSDEFNNTGEFKQVVVGNGSDWKILRDDETGEPRYKVNDRPVRVVYKGKDGWCYYVKNVYFARKYNGNGEFGNPKFVKATKHHRINCRSIK